MVSVKYLAIKNEIVAAIEGGRYAETGVLPSELTLARQFGAARETVRRAIAELVREGLLERRRGAGTYLSKRAQKRSGRLGLLIPDRASAEIFGSFADEAVRIGSRNGYAFSVCELEQDTLDAAAVRARRMARQLVVNRVEGVIFRPFLDDRLAKANQEVLRIFRNADTPVVLIDSDVVAPPERSECDLVAIDNVSAGRRVAEHLFETHRSRVGFLMNGRSVRTNVNWRNRLFGVAGELALRGAENAVRVLDFRPDDTSALERLYRSRYRPDAIVCGNDETAVLLVAALRKVGKRVPEDVAVVGFDDAACARACVPPLTTIRQPVRPIVRTALRMLLSRIANPPSTPRETYLPAPLVVRAST